MAYNENVVAERLAHCWDRPDLGASAAWLDLEQVEDEDATAPDRPPVALDDCIERLRTRALVDRMGGDLPVFLQTTSRPRPARRPKAPPRYRVPHPAVLSALYGRENR